MKETEERQTVRFGEDWVDMGLFTYVDPSPRRRPDAIGKFNPHHDAKGRFASGNLGASAPLVESSYGASSARRTRAEYVTPNGERLTLMYHENRSNNSLMNGVSIGAENSKGEEVALLSASVEQTAPNAPYVIQAVRTASEYQRQGVASALLEMARRHADRPVEHSKKLTDDGKAFSEVAKFNPHHDGRGRFASAGAGEGPGSFGGGGGARTDPNSQLVTADPVLDAKYPSVSLSRSHRMTVNTLADRVLRTPMGGAIAAEEATKDGINLNVLWPRPYVEVRVSAYHREKERYVERNIPVDFFSAKNRISVGLELVLSEVAVMK